MTTTTTAGAVAPITSTADRAGDINTATDIAAALAEHAAEIRARGRRVIDDVVEIGRRLSECREIVKRGQWVPWLEDNFGWSDDTALRFMKVYALTNEEPFNSRKLREWNLPLSAVYLISEQSTPPEACTEIIARAEAGEVLSVPEIKRVIASSKKPVAAKKATTARAAKTAPANVVASAEHAAGNDVDTEQSAEQRKQAAAADEVVEITKPASKATRSMSKATYETKSREKVAWQMATALDVLDLVTYHIDNEPDLVDPDQLDRLDEAVAAYQDRRREMRAAGMAQSARGRAV